jgi:hypothetical protein
MGQRFDVLHKGRSTPDAAFVYGGRCGAGQRREAFDGVYRCAFLAGYESVGCSHGCQGWEVLTGALDEDDGVSDCGDVLVA